MSAEEMSTRALRDEMAAKYDIRNGLVNVTDQVYLMQQTMARDVIEPLKRIEKLLAELEQALKND